MNENMRTAVPEMATHSKNLAWQTPVQPSTANVRQRPPARRLIGNQAAQRLVQAKLAINPPGDRYEQEADRAAEMVLGNGRMAPLPITPLATAPSRRCACGGIVGPGGECAACRRKRLALQTKESQMSSSAPAPKQTAHLLSQSSGQSLPHDTRHFFESRFNQDFSGVRIHTGQEAAEQSTHLRARAFTAGQDIVFGTGEYAPETPAGKKLLAHELTHVIQQNISGLRIQRQPDEKAVNWVPGMRAKLLKNAWERDKIRFYTGETVEIISTPWLLGYHSYIRVRAIPSPGVTLLWSGEHAVDVADLEPVASPLQSPSEEKQVQFQVNVLSEAAFASATGIDPANLPEGTLIPFDQAQAIGAAPDAPWLQGAAPGIGMGWSGAPWPSFSVPAYATGVQWTQTGFGHFSQFANIPGNPIMGGYRSYGLVHGYQGLHSKATGQPWTRPVPGGYFSDWWFRLLSPQSQTMVYRTGTPQHANLVAELIAQGRYTEHYTFPPPASGAKCTNCITVPQAQTYGALGGKPVIVTETGVYDITEFGRPSPQDPFTVEQAGRGKTMREWVTQPTVQTPTGQIETLEVAKVPRSNVWGTRGVACIRAGGVVMLVFGAYKTTERLEEAAGTPYFHRVVGQEAGSWVGGIIGGALGAAAAGAVACSPTGPGAFACAAAGFVGGLIVGAAGSMLGAIGGDYVAEKLEGVDAAVQTAGELYGPMIERSIWGDKPMPEMGYYPPRQYWDNPYEYEQEKERYMKNFGK